MKNKRVRISDMPMTGNEAGVALLLALVFIALLTVLVFGFIFEMEVDASFAQNQGADFQAQLAAHSAVVDGMLTLAEHYSEMLESGMPPIDSVIDNSQWAGGVAFTPLNEATMRTAISDEYSKLNLNALFIYNQGNKERNEPLITALRHFFAVRDDSLQDPVDAILDWVDYGDMDATEPDGAESDYYLSLENPYPCKNGPMDTIEELLLIKGITPEIYFGNAEQDQEPLSEYLTVHGDWLGRVNVNTAKEDVLAAVIAGHTGVMDMERAAQIYDEARHTPFENLSRLRQFIPPPPSSQQRRRPRARQPEAGEMPQGAPVDERGLQQREHAEAMSQMFRVHSNKFRIRGDGMMNETMVRVEAFMMRQPYDAREIEERLAGLGREFEQEFYDIPRQMFRVLDWKVIQ